MGCVPMDEVECPNCGQFKQSLGKHWGRSKDCSHPPLSDEQMDVATGLLLGDGTLTRNYKNSVLQVKMVKEEYLDYLSEFFGPFGLEVKLHKTADEQAEMNRNGGFSPGAKGENYQDVYRWMTRAHPDLNELRSWYESGEKVFPDEIDMSPELLKTWYVCDGDLHQKRTVRISSIENPDKLISYFTDSPIPEPRTSGNRIYWTVEDSAKVFEYMGSPLPGFEYKWPEI